MRGTAFACGALLSTLLGCHTADTQQASGSPAQSRTPATSVIDTPPARSTAGGYLGFDRNDYPGDDLMRSLHRNFAFTGYWLTNPPGETTNTWVGKRGTLRAQGWGFLVLANGRLDAEILRTQKNGTSPAALGRQDAAQAVQRAHEEGFPARTILFLDQEEGGRLLDEQAAYLLAWTEAVSTHGFRAGVYASGQQVSDGPGARIDTVEDIRARVKNGHLQNVAIFDALDQCGPAPGCTLEARPLGDLPDDKIDVWQYAQSPRRPEITKACAATYNPDGNCYAPGAPGTFLDMNVARVPDPSGGR